MKIKKSHIYNSIFVVFIVLMILPQTRKPIQVTFHKVKTFFSPSIEKEGTKETLNDYNWALIDDSNEELNFKDAKNKVVLVNLWATWCPPCIAELPSMNKLYKDYGDKVTFLFVSNENLDRVSSFLKRKELDIPSYKPLTAGPRKLSSRSIPATFIIGKDGKIHVNERGAANWNSNSVRALLDRLLEE